MVYFACINKLHGSFMSTFSISQSNQQQKRKIFFIQRQLQTIVKSRLEGLEHYGFAKVVIRAVKQMQLRYMYSIGILEDIEKIHNYGMSARSSQSQNQFSETVEEELKNSCLIMENQVEGNQLDSRSQQGQENYSSFQNNLKNNKSMVGILNILYRREIQIQQYSQSLKLFLKWANMFQQHSYGGFLRPIYRSFYDHLKTFPKDKFTQIADEVCVFVQFMVSVFTQIYGLKLLAQLQVGKLIKNENVYNLVMALLFKKHKIKRFLIQCIRHNDQDKIDRFQKQLLLLAKKPTFYFGVSKVFTLYDTGLTESQISKDMQIKKHLLPYEQSLKLVDQLCNTGSPVTKLKIIIAVSKRIMKDIEQYYADKGMELPELDPDNLSSIVMYLLVKTGEKNIYEQLRLVEHFTTNNCLNCISGYYLNVFIASIESLLELTDKEGN